MNANGLTRRGFIGTTSAIAGGLGLLQSLYAQTAPIENGASFTDGNTNSPPGQPGKHYTPVITPNGSSLPWKIMDGVKIYHFIAEEVLHEFAPGLVANCWGYNGSVHGPTLEAVEGDRVRIYLTNKLSAPTTLHWHGLFLPNGMDGVGGLSQVSIEPGETYKYEFTLKQHGTFMYHSHYDEMTQMGMGMMGMFIVHPRHPVGPLPDHDFAIMLSEWAIKPGTSRPNPNEMKDFNILTMNARCYPGTAPLVVKQNALVRIRLGNLGAMDHHPIHLHGHRFFVTETDGGQIAPSARRPETTVLVAVGQTRTVEFIADAPGDWAFHCHMSHHVMNQMGHDAPNVIGMKPGDLDKQIRTLVPSYMTMGQDGMGGMEEMGMPVPKNSIPMVGGRGQFGEITMGGMFTILKVRPNLADYPADGGWYKNPKGEVATIAPEEDLRRDGINVSG
jgi:FtsP/CotA-like multicopper oxidase with cupredoxin domain